MTLEKITRLHSVEILARYGAIQAAWHTNIYEDGNLIAGPSIHRAAYKVTDASVLPAEVAAQISAETMAALIATCASEQELTDGRPHDPGI